MANSTWSPDSPQESTLVYLHYAYPVVLLLVFLGSFMVYSVVAAPPDASLNIARGISGPGGKPLPATKKRGLSAYREALQNDFSPGRKAVFNWLSFGVVLTLVANSTAAVTHSLIARKDGWWAGQSAAVYSLGSVTVYTLILVCLIDSAPSPTWAHAFTWLVALAMELVLLCASVLTYTRKHREPSSHPSGHGPTRTSMSTWEGFETAVDLLRVVLLLALVGFWAFFSWQRAHHVHSRRAAEHESEETIGLLNGHTKSSYGSDSDYGSVHSGRSDEHDSEDEHEERDENWKRPEKIPQRSWYEYLRGYSLFFPYLWPSKSAKLQLTVVFCFALVLLQRGVNVLVPNQTTQIVNEFTDNPGHLPYKSIGLYIFYRVLQGNDGLIGVLRTMLWMPVSQYAYRELSTASFEHIHSLDSSWHAAINPSEVNSALSKGTAINDFLESITFKLAPMIVDMFIAVAYFLVQYDAYYALVLFIMVIVYLFLTVRMSRCRNDLKRKTTTLSRKLDAVRNDSLQLHDQVKNFNAEEREFKKFGDLVDDYQKAQYVVTLSMQALQVSQLAVFAIALLATCFIAAYQVTVGDIDVGKFVGLISYMVQLQAPLTGFSDFYKSMQSGLINAERVLEFFKIKPTVVDEPGAKELRECDGDIRLDDVEFAYDSRNPALKGTSFHCAPGTTTALVGESGGGKSTMFKLLYRLFNITGGHYMIDGQDVRDFTIDSVRRHIGVVPQNPNLFNESIMYNLRYANPDATDEEVFAAAKAACIHDKIMSFPDGYEHQVGNRGDVLSGGEKQRIAIARCILKNARIILLDEATAQLDSNTEHNIQEAFDLLKENRTLLVIAHRLPTIASFDQILVLKDGKIAETGTHKQLLAQNGIYTTLWKNQMRADRATEQARHLFDKAKRLTEGQIVDTTASASQSEDERCSPATPKSIADKRGHRKQISSLALTCCDSDSQESHDSHDDDSLHKA